MPSRWAITSGGPSRADELRLAEALADHAAAALENARLYTEAGDRWREAELLGELARAVNASLDLDTVLGRVTAAARELCDAGLARIALRESGGEAMVFRYAAGPGSDALEPGLVTPGQGPAGEALAAGHAVRRGPGAGRADPHWRGRRGADLRGPPRRPALRRGGRGGPDASGRSRRRGPAQRAALRRGAGGPRRGRGAGSPHAAGGRREPRAGLVVGLRVDARPGRAAAGPGRGRLVHRSPGPA